MTTPVAGPPSSPAASHVGGDLGGRDNIVVGDLNHTYAAIGAGARLIVQMARSRVGEIRREERFVHEQLADGLEAQLDRYRRAGDATAFAPTRNPYRALKSYEIEHAPLFYGRAADIERLWPFLNRPLTVVRAESGAGKSSLLKAGLAARLLAGGHLPIYLRPIDRSPGEALKAWFAPGYATQPGFERLRADGLTGFLERVVRLVDASSRQVIVVLVDQFEEFFYYLPEAERRRFAAELAACVERLRSVVRWVFAIRDEKYAGFGEFHPDVTLSFQETYALRWTVEQAHETIVEPARLCGLAYAPELPDRVIADLTPDGEALSPLHLQLVCHTLFEARDGDPRPITTADYQRMGGARGILEHYLQDVLARAAAVEEREAARFVLGELVTSDYRRARRSAVALAAQWQVAAPDSRVELPHVLNSLVANGLLVARGAGASAEYELTHDFLAQRIQLDPHTQARKLAMELLAQDVRLWRDSPPGDEALISRERLARIEPYAGAAALGDDERELLRRSRARLDEQERQEVTRLEREVAALRRSSRLQRVMVALFAAGTLGLLFLLFRPSVLRYRAANAVPLVPVLARGMAFAIEAYEVTNERYEWCRTADRCDTPNGFSQVKADWGTNRLKPVINVDAAQAMAFCQWIGRTLPTAEQWMLIAPPFTAWREMGPDEALLCHLQPDELCAGPQAALTPVGANRRSQYAAASGAGVYDLVGSVTEWTRTQRVITDGIAPADIDVIPLEQISLILLGENYRVPSAKAGDYRMALEAANTSDSKSDAIGIRCVE